MNFMQLLQSLDDLLYEVMSWLVFFPITLWRTITRPLQMMEYAGRELHDQPDKQYDETLSPPLFLLLALLSSHIVELALAGGVNPIVQRTTGLAAFVDTDSKLLLLRLMIFSIIPLLLATALLVGSKQPIARGRLKAPFYAQCYPAAAFALVLGMSGLLLHHASVAAKLGGLAIMLGSIIGYFAVELAWFRRQLHCGLLAAAGYAGVAICGGIALAVSIALLFT